jgi:hypothetical protein
LPAAGCWQGNLALPIIDSAAACFLSEANIAAAKPAAAGADAPPSFRQMAGLRNACPERNPGQEHGSGSLSKTLRQTDYGLPPK